MSHETFQSVEEGLSSELKKNFRELAHGVGSYFVNTSAGAFVQLILSAM
jgi:hypothetical protein